MTPNINLDLDTRMAVLKTVPQVETLIDQWPNATPDETLEVITRIGLMSAHLLIALQNLNEALAAIGHAVDAHPNPDIRNITVDGQALHDQALRDQGYTA